MQPAIAADSRDTDVVEDLLVRFEAFSRATVSSDFALEQMRASSVSSEDLQLAVAHLLSNSTPPSQLETVDIETVRQQAVTFLHSLLVAINGEGFHQLEGHDLYVRQVQALIESLESHDVISGIASGDPEFLILAAILEPLANVQAGWFSDFIDEVQAGLDQMTWGSKMIIDGAVAASVATIGFAAAIAGGVTAAYGALKLCTLTGPGVAFCVVGVGTGIVFAVQGGAGIAVTYYLDTAYPAIEEGAYMFTDGVYIIIDATGKAVQNAEIPECRQGPPGSGVIYCELP
jgi:hypothetical protein